MNFDYRKYPSPGEIQGVIQDLQEQQRAHRTEIYLTERIGEAITHLEHYRNLLTRAYVEQSCRDKYNQLKGTEYLP